MATNISFSTYGFMNGILILSEENWRRFFKPFITDSVQSGLATIAGANMTVYVSAGECRCGAVMGILDEMIALDIANGDSTYDRIDSVIVQYTYGEPSTLAVAIVQGTPSANPVPPTLTKVYDTLWQMEIAQILVPSGATSSSEFTITDKRVIYESIESIIDDNTESEERVWSSQKTHEEIVSLSTEMYDSLNTKADAIERTTSGDIVTITDGADNIPVKELVVGIEPVQDLHGYDNPWPAGGGKNLLPCSLTSQTQGRYSISVDNEGIVNITALSSGSGSANKFTYGRVILPAGTYKVNGVTNGGASTYFIDFTIGSLSGTRILAITNGDNTMTLENETDVYVSIGIGTQGLPNANDSATFKPMIRLSSVTDATFAPYANICPISGWNNAIITRTGKNLINYLESESGGIDTNGNLIAGVALIRSTVYTICKPNTTYTFSSEKDTTHPWTFRLYFYDASHNFIFPRAQNTNELTATSPENAVYMKWSLNHANTATDISVLASINLQLELGSTATAYEPYSGTSVTIDLNGTRYGGTLNILTGMLTVDRGMVIFDGANNGNRVSYKYPNRYVYNLSAPLVGNTLIPTPNVNTLIGCLSDYFQNITDNQAYDGSRNGFSTSTSGGFAKLSAPSIKAESQADMNAWLAENPVTVVYPLASPVSVQLTANQLSTLLGDNAIFANSGDVVATYRADTKTYIEQKIAETNRKTCEMMTIVTDKMIAPDNLVIGDLVIVGEDLYKVINSNIASGEEMTVGTNVIKITLAEYIQSLI